MDGRHNCIWGRSQETKDHVIAYSHLPFVPRGNTVTGQYPSDKDTGSQFGPGIYRL